MVIASFNCNSIRARIEVLKRWLPMANPDVVALQETKVEDKDFPAEDFQSLGYEIAFKGEKSYNGVAILSKYKFDDVFYGFDGKGADEGSRLLAVQIKKLHIVNTYIPQGFDPQSEKFQYKLQWFSRLRTFFESRYKKSDKLIWLGDFNVAPEPIDVHNPKRLLGSVGYHPEEHKALAIVKEWGFVDVFREHIKEGGHYTFWDYRVKDGVARGLGWRVDHIWATESIAGKSIRSWIDREPRLWEKPSDHTPILAEISL
ncbi:MAG: Exodeoxyribonuclease III [Spirochaetes bacterium ADurb.Bin218]|jgi:exodeoxyribonuclease-3|nr:exodeoxyribonuclease III [Spirochaetota bacterium]OQA97203.1 MAG: Exodeoxyribonuclease III [Spirochaetes bacterium ADurb.Bin218]HOQ12733.1 exodeoxyribonuclease III [Spirochaetota bacterium]HPX91815.1 exodeoxyribonuclease III [Spirochaetota bacterium]